MTPVSVVQNAKVVFVYPTRTTMGKDSAHRPVTRSVSVLVLTAVSKLCTQHRRVIAQTQACHLRWDNGSIFVLQTKPVKFVMAQPIARLMVFASRHRIQCQPRSQFLLNVAQDAMETINARQVIGVI